ncbi:MAG: hypothetical protein H6581_03840 [Bacteroidia bacterium]|nr:hypothetical protein [Bacteroidia bacterium]
MNLKNIQWLFLIILFGSCSHREFFPPTDFIRFYGTGQDETGHSIIQTFDGDFVVVGWADSTRDNPDGFIMKTDPGGNLLWRNWIGWPESEESLGAGYELQNGDIITMGQTNRLGNNDFFYAKINPAGDTLETRIYGNSPLDEHFNEAISLPGGRYLLYGEILSDGYYKIRVIMIDEMGKLLTEKEFGIPEQSEMHAYGLSVMEDGSLTLVGSVRDKATVREHSWFMRLSANCDSLASRYLDLKFDQLPDSLGNPGNPVEDFVSSVSQNKDGSLSIFGRANMDDQDSDKEIFYLRTDLGGQILYGPKVIPGGHKAENLGSNNALPVRPDEFLLFGTTGSVGNGGDDFKVTWFTFDPIREEICYENITILGGQRDELPRGLILLPHGSDSPSEMLITGDSKSFGRTDSDLFLLRTQLVRPNPGHCE